MHMEYEKYAEFHERKYAELDKEFKEGAVKFLSETLHDKVKQQIRDLHAAHGAEWIHSIPMGHFGFGMGIRNLLRQNGFTDARISDKTGKDENLDDYYCQLLEAAAGARNP